MAGPRGIKKKKKRPFSQGVTVDNKAAISKTISMVFTMDRPHNDRHGHRWRSFHVRIPSSGLILIRRPHSRHQILLTLHQWLEGMEGAGEVAGGELVDKRQLGWGEGGGGGGGRKEGIRCVAHELHFKKKILLGTSFPSRMCEFGIKVKEGAPLPPTHTPCAPPHPWKACARELSI